MRRFPDFRAEQFAGTVFFIVVLRFLDLFITYVYTPDLKHEVNPIILFFKASWTGFFLSQAAVVILIAICAFLYFNRRETVVEAGGLRYPGFVYFYFNGRLRPWSARLTAYRALWKRHLVFDGFLIVSMSIVASIFAITNNLLLIWGWKWYQQFIVAHYKVYLPAVFLVSTIVASNVFFVKAYHRYKADR